MKKIIMISMCFVGLSMTLTSCASPRSDVDSYAYPGHDADYYTYGDDGIQGAVKASRSSRSADRMFESSQRK